VIVHFGNDLLFVTDLNVDLFNFLSAEDHVLNVPFAPHVVLDRLLLYDGDEAFLVSFLHFEVLDSHRSGFLSPYRMLVGNSNLLQQSVFLIVQLLNAVFHHKFLH